MCFTPASNQRSEIPAGEVHVWQIPLASEGEAEQRLRELLTDREQARADRFRFPSDRLRCITARGWLRRLAGQYLQADPAALVFQFGQKGKPSLAAAGATRLSFNVSHAHQQVLIALAWDIELGVDIENVRPMREALAIAESHFTPAETELLRTSQAGIDATFFRIWTRKEAIIKALGTGLWTPLNQFDATSRAMPDIWLRVTAPAAVASESAADSPPRTPAASRTLFVRDLPVATGYVAALATDVQPQAVCMHELSPEPGSY